MYIEVTFDSSVATLSLSLSTALSLTSAGMKDQTLKSQTIQTLNKSFYKNLWLLHFSLQTPQFDGTCCTW